MVEFGLTFVFFVFIVLAVINLMLVAYNFNLGQRASWEACRLAAVGGTNNEIATVVYNQFTSQFFSSPFMVSRIEFDSRTFITPNNMFERVEGRDVEVNMAYRIGFSFMAMSAIQGEFPIHSKLVVIARNDNDRDGYFDTTTVTWAGTPPNNRVDSRPSNHDADALGDTMYDNDFDNDGRANFVDTGILLWNGASYTLDTGAGPRLVTKLTTTGRFFARVIHVLSNGTYDSGPYPLRSQAIPRRTGVTNPVMLDLSYDRNNNGWEDKYD